MRQRALWYAGISKRSQRGGLETFSYSSSSFFENPWFYWVFWVFLCTLREAFLAIFSQSSRRFLAFFKDFWEIFCTFLNSWVTIRDNLIAYGGVLKWPKRSVLKTERSLIATRGFNSLHLRHMPWNVMFQGFFLSVGLGYHSHTLAYATTTYHKRFHKSRDYSGLYGINLIIFCAVFLCLLRITFWVLE